MAETIEIVLRAPTSPPGPAPSPGPLPTPAPGWPKPGPAPAPIIAPLLVKPLPPERGPAPAPIIAPLLVKPLPPERGPAATPFDLKAPSIAPDSADKFRRPTPLADNLGTAEKALKAFGMPQAGQVAGLGSKLTSSASQFANSGDGNVAGMLGPAAAAFALGAEVRRQIEAATAAYVRSLANMAEGMARLDIGPVADQFASLAARLPLFGPAVAEAIQGFRRFTSALDETARRLSPFSGPLASAVAMSNVNQIVGDIRRAQLLGADLARFTNARSQLSQAGQDVLAEALKSIIPMVTDVTQQLADVLRQVQRWIADPAQGASDLLGIIQPLLFREAGDMVAVFRAVFDMARATQRIADNTRRPVGDEDLGAHEFLVGARVAGANGVLAPPHIAPPWGRRRP